MDQTNPKRANLLTLHLQAMSMKVIQDQSSIKSEGTGEVTVGCTTLLFWNDHKHTKTIQHHPHLMLPMFYANRGRTLKNLINGASQYQPYIPQCLNTYIPMKAQCRDGKNITHIIPTDNDESQYYKSLPTLQQPLIVDELDKQHRSNQHKPDGSTECIPCPLDKVEAGEGDTLNDDNTSVTSIESKATSVCSSNADDDSVESRPPLTHNNLDNIALRFAQGMNDVQKE